MTPEPFDPCTCAHLSHQHGVDGAGYCRALDSYGEPCACPGFERDPNDPFRPGADE
jgi:hypothetical protein